jgi:hypothetical protein
MSATTKLPTNQGSVGTWGAELNDFLNQALVGSTTAGINNGLLKEDHAAGTRGGKVGVGTAAPTNKLHVTDTTNPVKIEGLVAGATTDDVVTISPTGVMTKTTKASLIPAATATGTFNKVGTTTASIVETDDVYHTGNVGVGISTPTSKLHIVGQAGSAGNENSLLVQGTDLGSIFNYGVNEGVYIRGGKTSSSVSISDLPGAGTTYINTSSSNVAIGGYTYDRLNVQGLDGTAAASKGISIQSQYPSLSLKDNSGDSHIGTQNSGILSFYPNSTTQLIDDAVTPKLTVSSIGVGVGVKTPFYAFGNSLDYNPGDGNLGVIPATALAWQADTIGYIACIDNKSTTEANACGLIVKTNIDSPAPNTGSTLYVGNKTSPYLAVKTDGKVGIGTNTPTQALEVNGNILSTSVDTTGNILNGMVGASFIQYINLNIPNNGTYTKLFGIRDIANLATFDLALAGKSDALIKLRITGPDFAVCAMLSVTRFGQFDFCNIAIMSKSVYLGDIRVTGPNASSQNDVEIINNGTGPLAVELCAAEVIKLFTA